LLNFSGISRDVSGEPNSDEAAAQACELNFIAYAQVIKLYGATAAGPGRYSPAECIGIKKVRVEGNPDEKDVSTSLVEAHNKTMRMHMRRFTRLTNGHSNKVANDAHMVALYTLSYNLIRTHSKLKMTPAMQAGTASTFMAFDDVIARIDAANPIQPSAGLTRRLGCND
jgi:hypothetical protein